MLVETAENMHRNFGSGYPGGEKFLRFMLKFGMVIELKRMSYGNIRRKFVSFSCF